MPLADFGAIQELSRLPNVEMKISLDGRRRRMHAKAWLFQRDNGFSSVYVGSANLSGPALEDGIEWTVKLSEVEAPHIVERFRGAFDSLWCDEEFEQFRPDDEEFCRRVKLSLEYARRGPSRTDSGPPVFFDLRPHPYQQATLDQLETERIDRGHFRNLGRRAPPVPARLWLPRSTTIVSRSPEGGLGFCFPAHREELLLPGARPVSVTYCVTNPSETSCAVEKSLLASITFFTTIQSFRSRALFESQGAAYWDYAVLDEAHHIPAEGYREIIGSPSSLVFCSG